MIWGEESKVAVKNIDGQRRHVMGHFEPLKYSDVTLRMILKREIAVGETKENGRTDFEVVQGSKAKQSLVASR